MYNREEKEGHSSNQIMTSSFSFATLAKHFTFSKNKKKQFLLNALLKEMKQFISQFLKPQLLKKHSYKQNNKLSIPITKTLKQVNKIMF